MKNTGDLTKVLSSNIMTLRRKLKMNQEDLAHKSGLSLSAIKKIEQGKAWPHKETLLALSGALEQSIEILINPIVTAKDLVNITDQDLQNRALIARIRELEAKLTPENERLLDAFLK